MSLSAINNDRDVKVKDFDGNQAINSVVTGALIPPYNADAITVLYPNNRTEVYQFRNGGLAGSIIKTITIIYTNNSKNDLESVEAS